MSTGGGAASPSPVGRFRQIRGGFEKIASRYDAPRHAHLHAYVSIVLAGGYDQAGFAGRVRLEPGDVLVQPALDRHESRQRRREDLHVLRLPWAVERSGLGGLYRPDDLDLVVRTAERDLIEASALLAEGIGRAAPRAVRASDWPDLLAAALRSGQRVKIAEWAHAQGLARESVARGFCRTFGVPPRTFTAELRAREAWLRTVFDDQPLAAIAADLQFADQAHMTRAVGAFTGAPPRAWRRRLVLGVQSWTLEGA
ncbi:MAG: transcriptional regulator, AraC family [Caulobacter sp.]|nr:transcriptional regulator, AraC family [Caulobacter sp.]